MLSITYPERSVTESIQLSLQISIDPEYAALNCCHVSFKDRLGLRNVTKLIFNAFVSFSFCAGFTHFFRFFDDA